MREKEGKEGVRKKERGREGKASPLFWFYNLTTAKGNVTMTVLRPINTGSMTELYRDLGNLNRAAIELRPALRVS